MSQNRQKIRRVTSDEILYFFDSKNCRQFNWPEKLALLRQKKNLTNLQKKKKLVNLFRCFCKIYLPEIKIYVRKGPFIKIKLLFACKKRTKVSQKHEEIYVDFENCYGCYIPFYIRDKNHKSYLQALIFLCSLSEKKMSFKEIIYTMWHEIIHHLMYHYLHRFKAYHNRYESKLNKLQRNYPSSYAEQIEDNVSDLTDVVVRYFESHY